MLLNCLSALGGAWALQLFSRLPPDWLLFATMALAAALFCVRKLRLAGFFLLGFGLVWVSSRAVVEDRLPTALEGQTLTVSGRVLDFTDARANPARFILATEGATEIPRIVRLSWYDAPDVPRIGESWTLTVRLRRPRGFSNPLRFDYEHWLFRQGIGATGYVVNGPGNRRQDAIPVDRLSALRQRLVDRMIDVLGRDSATAVLLAITVGATHEISRAEWERYAVSGTSHLMAISGMNIAMAAGGAFLLAWLLLAPFCRRANLRDLAAMIAVVAAIAYAEISGFAIPVRRAMLMAVFVVAAGLLRRQLRAGRLLAATCIVLVVTDPLAVQAPGFKLSFAAVAILLWAARQHGLAGNAGASAVRRVASAAGSLTALQLTLLFGLFPLTALLFGRVAWLAPLVNMLVLPLFNVVTVPAGLLGLLLDGPLSYLGDGLLVIARHSVRLMLWLIEAVASWQPAHTHIASIEGAMLLVAFLPALWAVAPPGFPGRKLSWIAAVAIVLHKPAPPPPGCLDLTALDVGQGLSLVLRTPERTIVYDTGPSFRSGSDTGALVVVPYLRAIGVNRLDLLVVSHADNDHSGGVASLLEEIDVTEIIAGEHLPAVQRKQKRCRGGQAWIWDGIRFSFMQPSDYALTTDNNASCVLEIAAGPHEVLLTGDIESPVEANLVRNDVLSPVELVVVPHHGSRTSSTPLFVQHLRPATAIVSAGHDNRWGLPKKDVVERWQAAGAKVLNTATSGAIEYRVCPTTGAVLASENRKHHRQYWHAP